MRQKYQIQDLAESIVWTMVFLASYVHFSDKLQNNVFPSFLGYTLYNTRGVL